MNTSSLAEAAVAEGRTGATARSDGAIPAPKPPTHFHRIFVATDGETDAVGALRAADLLAQRDRATVDVLSVVEPHFGGRVPRTPREAWSRKLQRRIARVTRQVRETVGSRPTWPISFRIGGVPETVARCAAEHDADLIVVGLGRHRPADRLLGTETALAVARIATVPLLAVPATFRSLPRVALLGADFSRASIRAARAALGVLAKPAVMHLAYVHTDYEPFPREPEDPDVTYAAGFAAFFDALEEELGRPTGVSFERVLMRGDPASELLAYAGATAVDLIAVGSHGQTTLERFVFGSAATRIIRGADRCVLVSGLLTPASATESPSTHALETALSRLRVLER